MLFMCSKHLHSGNVTVILSTCCVGYKGLCKVKKHSKKSKNNLEVGGWVQVPFG